MVKKKEEEMGETTDVGIPAALEAEAEVEVVSEVPVKVFAVLGRKMISLKELLEYKVGELVDFDRPANEIVDLVANGQTIAKGELVEIDGKLGVKIVKMVR